MTLEEAKIFLSFKNADEIEDIYEEKVFEAKQFFVSKFPISKVINSRISKMRKIESAWNVLTKIPHENQFENTNYSFSSSNLISEIWNEYQEKRNQLKLKIQQADNFISLETVVRFQIDLLYSFCEKLELIPIQNEKNQIIIGKEPDPMEIHFDIQQWKDKGIERIEQISLIDEDSPLGIELKRLSLWLNLEING